MSDFDLNPDLYSLENEPDDSFLYRQIDELIAELDALLIEQGFKELAGPNLCRNLHIHSGMTAGEVLDKFRAVAKVSKVQEAAYIAFGGSLANLFEAEKLIRAHHVTNNMRAAWVHLAKAREWYGVAKSKLIDEPRVHSLLLCMPRLIKAEPLAKKHEAVIQGAKGGGEKIGKARRCDSIEIETRVLDRAKAYCDLEPRYLASAIAKDIGKSRKTVKKYLDKNKAES